MLRYTCLEPVGLNCCRVFLTIKSRIADLKLKAQRRIVLWGTVTPHGRFPASGRNVVVGIPDIVQAACSAIRQAPATNLHSVI